MYLFTAGRAIEQVREADRREIRSPKAEGLALTGLTPYPFAAAVYPPGGDWKRVSR